MYAHTQTHSHTHTYYMRWCLLQSFIGSCKEKTVGGSWVAIVITIVVTLVFVGAHAQTACMHLVFDAVSSSKCRHCTALVDFKLLHGAKLGAAQWSSSSPLNQHERRLTAERMRLASKCSILAKLDASQTRMVRNITSSPTTTDIFIE